MKAGREVRWKVGPGPTAGREESRHQVGEQVSQNAKKQTKTWHQRQNQGRQALATQDSKLGAALISRLFPSP